MSASIGTCLAVRTYRHLYEEVRQRSTEALYDEFVRPFTVDRDQPRPLPKPTAFGLWSKAFIGEDDRVVPPDEPRELLAHPGRAFHAPPQDAALPPRPLPPLGGALVAHFLPL